MSAVPDDLYAALTADQLAQAEACGYVDAPVLGFDSKAACDEWAAEHDGHTEIVKLIVNQAVSRATESDRDSGTAWTTTQATPVWLHLYSLNAVHFGYSVMARLVLL